MLHPPIVLNAKHRAYNKGVLLFDDSYIPPYQVFWTTLGTLKYSDIVWEFPKKVHSEYCNAGYQLSKVAPVLFGIKHIKTGKTVGGFYNKKREAFDDRDMLNIRHFNIAALSDDPTNPIII